MLISRVNICQECDLRVGIAHATLPSLDNNNSLALSKNVELHSLTNTPLNSPVHVFLPIHLGEIWLAFGEMEGVDSAI